MGICPLQLNITWPTEANCQDSISIFEVFNVRGAPNDPLSLIVYTTYLADN